MIDEVLKEKLIPWGHHWQPRTGGFRLAKDPECFSIGTHEFRSDHELAKLHPDLPDALRVLSTVDPVTDDVIHSNQVSRMLLMLNTNLFVEDHIQTPIGMYVVSGLTPLVSYLEIEGTGYEYHEHHDETTDKTFRIVRGYGVPKVLVDMYWLDTNFTGWKTRMQFALELGLEPQEALAAALEITVVEPRTETPTDFAI